ncbi:hypothetical protein LRS56_07665 [Pseudomonas poae]|nr:hypothetical protein LRS56_07665 [Pseudomonas poae]
MFVIHRLLLVLGACCLWVNATQAAVGSGTIAVRLVITAGCEVTQRSADAHPAVRCSAAPDSPTQFTVSTAHEAGNPRTVVTLNW